MGELLPNTLYKTLDKEKDMKMIECICGEQFSQARFALGYRVCLKCGEARAKERKFCVVPMHKSNYVAMFNRDDVKGINNKGGLIK